MTDCAGSGPTVLAATRGLTGISERLIARVFAARRRHRALIIPVLAAFVPVSCSAPPLTLYSLAAPAAQRTETPLPAKPVVIAIARVSIPDELDSEDIMSRDGSVLRRSPNGRWASRLSVGISDRLTQRLAERRPDALVTDRPLTETPTYRILINIGRMDISASGPMTLNADWLIVPRDSARPARHHRATVDLDRSAQSDQQIVTDTGIMIDRLASAINVAGLR